MVEDDGQASTTPKTCAVQAVDLSTARPCGHPMASTSGPSQPMGRPPIPEHLLLFGFILEMSNQPATCRRMVRQAPYQETTLLPHNSLGSWDVFLSLFNSIVDVFPVDIVLLQDAPSCAGFLPSFPRFKSFAPPVPRTKVVIYLSLSFLSFYTALPEISPNTDDIRHLDVYTPLDTSAPSPPSLASPRFTREPLTLDPNLSHVKMPTPNWTSCASWQWTSTSTGTLATPQSSFLALRNEPRPCTLTAPQTWHTPFSTAPESTLGSLWKDSIDPL